MFCFSKCLKARWNESIALVTLSISTTMLNSSSVFCIVCLLYRKRNCQYVLLCKAVNAQKILANTGYVAAKVQEADVHNYPVKKFHCKRPFKKSTAAGNCTLIGFIPLWRSSRAPSSDLLPPETYCMLIILRGSLFFHCLFKSLSNVPIEISPVILSWHSIFLQIFKKQNKNVFHWLGLVIPKDKRQQQSKEADLKLRW